MARSERPKPGDCVLVRAVATHRHPIGVYQVRMRAEGGKVFAPFKDVCADPGIDPALIGPAIEAMREYRAASDNYRQQVAHGNREDTALARRRLSSARGRVRYLAARMDLPAGDEQEDDDD